MHGFQVARHLLCCSVLGCAVLSHCFLWVAVCTRQLIIPRGYLGDLHLGASGHAAVSNVMSKESQGPTVFKAAVTLYTPTNIVRALQLLHIVTYIYYSLVHFLQCFLRSIFCGLYLPKDILLIFPCGAYQSFVYLKKSVFNPFAHLKKNGAFYYWILWHLVRMASIGSSVEGLGLQLVELFGNDWEVWPSRRRCATGVGFEGSFPACSLPSACTSAMLNLLFWKSTAYFHLFRS